MKILYTDPDGNLILNAYAAFAETELFYVTFNGDFAETTLIATWIVDTQDGAEETLDDTTWINHITGETDISYASARGNIPGTDIPRTRIAPLTDLQRDIFSFNYFLVNPRVAEAN